MQPTSRCTTEIYLINIHEHQDPPYRPRSFEPPVGNHGSSLSTEEEAGVEVFLPVSATPTERDPHEERHHSDSKVFFLAADLNPCQEANQSHPPQHLSDRRLPQGRQCLRSSFARSDIDRNNGHSERQGQSLGPLDPSDQRGGRGASTDPVGHLRISWNNCRTVVFCDDCQQDPRSIDSNLKRCYSIAPATDGLPALGSLFYSDTCPLKRSEPKQSLHHSELPRNSPTAAAERVGSEWKGGQETDVRHSGQQREGRYRRSFKRRGPWAETPKYFSFNIGCRCFLFIHFDFLPLGCRAQSSNFCRIEEQRTGNILVFLEGHFLLLLI